MKLSEDIYFFSRQGEDLGLISFRNGTSALREVALSAELSYQHLIRTSDDSKIGYVVPPDALYILALQGITYPVPAVLSAKGFYTNLKDSGKVMPVDVCIVPFKQKGQNVGTAVIVLDETQWIQIQEQLADTCRNKPKKAKADTQSIIKTDTNPDNAIHFNRAHKSLQPEGENITHIVRDGEIFYRRSDGICAASPENALVLKEHLFPCDASIIQSVRQLDFKTRMGEFMRAVTHDGHFLRVSSNGTSQASENENRYTLIPFLAAEFFDLTEDSKIRGVHKKERINYNFSCDVDISSDFEHATKLRLKVSSDYQWRLLKAALIQAQSKRGSVRIFQASTTPHENTDTQTRDLRTGSGFSFSDTANIRVTLERDLSLRNLRINVQSQPALAGLAAFHSDIIELHRDNGGVSFQLS